MAPTKEGLGFKVFRSVHVGGILDQWCHTEQVKASVH